MRAQENLNKTAQRRKIKLEREQESLPSAVAERRKRMTAREKFDAAMERGVRRWRVLEAVRFGQVTPVLVEDGGDENDGEDVEMVDAEPLEGIKWERLFRGREVELIVLDD